MKIQRIFLENKAWVAEQLQNDPTYFSDSAKDQKPTFAWIGCSDSRVLPNEITGTSVGDLFVHRNIANVVVAEDLNLMCVLTYALEYLKAKHIVVCGHYGCGGVKAAMLTDSFGLLDGWLKHIKDVYVKNKSLLELIPNEVDRFDKLVDLNVLAQVQTVKTAPALQTIFKNNPGIQIHGWVYDMRTGYLKNLHRDTLGI